MLHVISAQCVARHLHMVAPRPLQRTCWRLSKISNCAFECNYYQYHYYLTQSQDTDSWPASSGPDPIIPGLWKGSHYTTNIVTHWLDLGHQGLSHSEEELTEKSNQDWKNWQKRGTLWLTQTKTAVVGSENRKGPYFDSLQRPIVVIWGTFPLQTLIKHTLLPGQHKHWSSTHQIDNC